jgi:hypothetical protein
MKQVTIRQLVRQSSQIEGWLPCEIVRDGEVIAIILPPHDVSQSTEAKQTKHTLSDKLTELPLSKERQASSTW